MRPAPLPSMPRAAAAPVLGGALAIGLATVAGAQNRPVFYSVDYHGPTKSRPATGTGQPISEGDILFAPGGNPAFGPLPAPQIAFDGTQLGITLHATCQTTVSGQPCGAELDAFSFGREDEYLPPGPGPRPRLYFSTDRFAVGAAVAVTNGTIPTESSGRDAAADVFTPFFPLNPPVGPTGVVRSNVMVLDGNGLPSSTTGAVRRGLGMVEPHSNTPTPGADAGDNLDALEFGPVPTGADAAFFYSLDGGFPDPAGVPNSNSAQLNGVSPAAVLRRSIGGGAPSIYAQPAQLGLSTVADDLDVLVLSENQVPGYQPSQVVFDWAFGIGPGTDMLLFSVRRGSAVIGQMDSSNTAPIEPGDLLTTPVPGGNGRPRIFIAAEALGLRTSRTDGVEPAQAEELDAAALRFEPFFDCNNNGVEDAEDIALGTSSDTNNNGIPDECERSYTPYCTCETGLGPCGNDSPGTGCLNSTGVGGLLDGVGTTAVTTDDLEFSASGMPGGASCLLFSGPGQSQTVFGDGLRCIPSAITRHSILAADGSGNALWGPGILADLCSSYSVCLTAGSTRNYQVWYRNAASYCTPSTFNLTNGLEVTYTP